jgi:hypothetical protein
MNKYPQYHPFPEVITRISEPDSRSIDHNGLHKQEKETFSGYFNPGLSEAPVKHMVIPGNRLFPVEFQGLPDVIT